MPFFEKEPSKELPETHFPPIDCYGVIKDGYFFGLDLTNSGKKLIKLKFVDKGKEDFKTNIDKDLFRPETERRAHIYCFPSDSSKPSLTSIVVVYGASGEISGKACC